MVYYGIWNNYLCNNWATLISLNVIKNRKHYLKNYRNKIKIHHKHIYLSKNRKQFMLHLLFCNE